MARALRSILVFLHRWMGVAFCLLFLMWFVSGMVLMYWDFPAVSRTDRLAHLSALDASRIQLSPVDAYARLGTRIEPRRVWLSMFDARPAYRFLLGDTQRVVFADDGQVLAELSPELTLRVAAAWTGLPAARANVVTQGFRWTVADHL